MRLGALLVGVTLAAAVVLLVLSALRDWIPRRSGVEAAAEGGDAQKVRAYLMGDPSLLRRRGRVLLAQACRAGKEGIVELLLKEGADPNEGDELGWTALHWAATDFQDGIVALLLAHGARINAPDACGCAPLHCAAQVRDSRQAILSLLTAGADPNARTSGDPALLSKERWQWSVIGPDGLGAEHPALAEITPLHLAAVTDAGNVEAVLSGGAEVDAASRGGSTALHFAARAGGDNVSRRLVDAGAALNARDEQGRTPLHVAAEAGNLEAVMLLSRAGAILDLRDKEGRTARDMASAAGYGGVFRWLTNAEAESEQRRQSE